MKEKFIVWGKFCLFFFGAQFLYALLRIKACYSSSEVISSIILIMFMVLFRYLKISQQPAAKNSFFIDDAWMFLLGILCSYHGDITGHNIAPFLSL